MPTNDFIGFASSGSANIASQADYAAAAEQGIGMQPGPASSKLANKAWRQGANMAAAIGKYIADHGYDALDNGDINALKNNLSNAFSVVDSVDTTTNGYIRFSNGLQFVWAREDVPSGSSQTGIVITYEMPFSAGPCIYTNVSFNTAYGYGYEVQPINRTATGCTFIIGSSSGGTTQTFTNGTFCYLAIGPWA